MIIEFITTYGKRLSVLCLVGNNEALQCGFQCPLHDDTGLPQIESISIAREIAKKLGGRVPTSTELHELALWLNINGLREYFHDAIFLSNTCVNEVQLDVYIPDGSIGYSHSDPFTPRNLLIFKI